MEVFWAKAQYWFALAFARRQPANHSQRRYTRILQSALTALAGRGVAILVSIVSVPLTIGYLGVERYGVWLTISTLLTWLTLADMGLGNGLLNALSEAFGQDRLDVAQRYVANAFWMLLVVAIGLGLLLALGWPWLDWAALFRIISPQARAELPPALALAAFFVLLGLPLSIAQRILVAYQRGMLANFWLAVGNVASLIGIVVVTQNDGGLPALVLGVMGAPALVNGVSFIWLFWKHMPQLLPSPKSLDFRHWSRLARTGLEFFMLQISALVLFHTDSLIISYFLGPDQVADYSLVYRLFAYVLLLQSFFLQPLWPAYGEAVARDDWPWVRRTFAYTLLWGMFAVVVLVAGLLIFAQPLVFLWTQGAVTAPMAVVWLMALWTVLASWGNTFAFLQNSLGQIRVQALAALITSGLNILLSISWVQSLGLPGVILATVVSYAAVAAWLAPLSVWPILRRPTSVLP